jgi:high-affinity Fe2+/Pb2+ permease
VQLEWVLALVAQVTTTTEEVPRIVGDPLPGWVVVLAGAALLAIILVAGIMVSRRSRS